MRSRPALLLFALIPSCSPIAIYTGSVSIEGIDTPDPQKLHWGIAPSPGHAAEFGTVASAAERAKTTAEEGRLQFEFSSGTGPVDIAFWYDVNGNETLDAGDKTGRIANPVEGADIGLGCSPRKTVVPHTHLGRSVEGSIPSPGPAEKNTGRLQPCAIDLHITGHLENFDGPEVDERHAISIMGHDHPESPETIAPIPLRKETVLELDLETKEGRDGSIRFDREDWTQSVSFGPDGRPTRIEIDHAADARIFTYTYRWDCAGAPPKETPAYHDDLVLDEP